MINDFLNELAAELICKVDFDKNNIPSIWAHDNERVDSLLMSESNTRKIIKPVIDALIEKMDIDDENCKGCLNSNDGEPVLWFLTRKVKGKIEYLQVGHNDSLKLMFANDIKYDLYDLLYGDGKRKGKYFSLREEESSFSFYAVHIEEFVQNVNVFFDSREIKLSSEIVDALNKKDVINKSIRVNCAEALLASILGCSLWNPAPQNGEEYYREYFDKLVKQIISKE